VVIFLYDEPLKQWKIHHFINLDMLLKSDLLFSFDASSIVCLQQKLISELLLAKQEPGKGYIPQCHPVTGEFFPKQCSRNGLVCWCVDPDGRKSPRSFGRAQEVKCTPDGAREFLFQHCSFNTRFKLSGQEMLPQVNH
jgi:hypothetical protein